MRTPTPRSRDLSAIQFVEPAGFLRVESESAFGGRLKNPPGDYSLMSASRPSPLTRTGNNGDNRIRTGDPLLAKQVLYQLSYVPKAVAGFQSISLQNHTI